MSELPDLTPGQPYSQPGAPQEQAATEPRIPAGGDETTQPIMEGGDAGATLQGAAPQSEFPSVPWGAEPSLSHRALPRAPWTRRDMVWGAMWGIGLLTVLGVLFAMVLAVMQDVTGGQLPAVAGLLATLAELVLLLPVWWFGIRKYHLPWSAVGLRDFAIVRGLGLGCMSLLFAFAFNVLWSLFLYFAGLTSQTTLLPLFGSGFGGLLLALFVGGVVAPIAEEVFFRGFLFGGLYREKGLWPAVIISATLFALVHITPTSWPPIFLLGVIFALLYEWTGSIWPAIVAHGTVNSLSFLMVYVLRALESLNR